MLLDWLSALQALSHVLQLTGCVRDLNVLLRAHSKASRRSHAAPGYLTDSCQAQARECVPRAGPGVAAPSFALGSVLDLETPLAMSPNSAAGRCATPAPPAGMQLSLCLFSFNQL